MNRVARLTALTFASLLALAPLASAQQSTMTQLGTRQSGNMPSCAGQGMPAGKMSIAFVLVRKVDSLNVISKDPKTAFTGAQATQLLALLEPLKTAKALTGARAASVSASIKKLLTLAQRPALRLAESQMGGGRPQDSQTRGRKTKNGRAQGGRMTTPPDANPFLSQHGSQILGTLLTSLRK